MKGRNPTVAALLGLFLGVLAYVYVWKLARGLAVFLVTLALSQVLFGAETELTPGVYAVSIAVNILISFDCWRIAKLSAPGKQEAGVEAKAGAARPHDGDQVIYVNQDIYCPKCKFGLAMLTHHCPVCHTHLDFKIHEKAGKDVYIEFEDEESSAKS